MSHTIRRRRVVWNQPRPKHRQPGHSLLSYWWKCWMGYRMWLLQTGLWSQLTSIPMRWLEQQMLQFFRGVPDAHGAFLLDVHSVLATRTRRRAVLTVSFLCLEILLPSFLHITASRFSLRLCDARARLLRLLRMWSHAAFKGDLPDGYKLNLLG